MQKSQRDNLAMGNRRRTAIEIFAKAHSELQNAKGLDIIF